MRRLGPLLLALTWWACTTNEWDPMKQQPKPLPYRSSGFFDDGRMMRAPPPGTVPRSRRGQSRVFTTGLLPNGDYTSEYPLPLTPELLHRGGEAFEAYCAACHGLLGDGESWVSRNMALRLPPSLLTLPEYPPGYWYTVISEGYGMMPGYADKLSLTERWAVAAYVEALRYSQRVPVEELPEDVRSRLEAQP